MAARDVVPGTWAGFIVLRGFACVYGIPAETTFARTLNGVGAKVLFSRGIFSIFITWIYHFATLLAPQLPQIQSYFTTLFLSLLRYIRMRSIPAAETPEMRLASPRLLGLFDASFSKSSFERPITFE